MEVCCDGGTSDLGIIIAPAEDGIWNYKTGLGHLQRGKVKPVMFRWINRIENHSLALLPLGSNGFSFLGYSRFYTQRYLKAWPTFYSNKIPMLLLMLSNYLLILSVSIAFRIQNDIQILPVMILVSSQMQIVSLSPEITENWTTVRLSGDVAFGKLLKHPAD